MSGCRAAETGPWHRSLVVPAQVALGLVAAYFDEMFLGRLPVAEALTQAQAAANAAARR